MQRRSDQKRLQIEQRIAAVLDATEHFAMTAEDIEDLSSTIVAERSKVSVGWLYDHVGDRQAIVDAVLLRGLRDMQKTIVAIGFDLSSDLWGDQIDLLVETTVNFLRSRRGFARLYYSRLAGPNTAAINFEIDQETARALSLSVEAGSPEDAQAIATMMTGIIDKGLELSFRIDEFESRTIVEQTKTAVRGYLRTYFTP